MPDNDEDVYKVMYDPRNGGYYVKAYRSDQVIYRGDLYVCQDFAFLMNGARVMRLGIANTQSANIPVSGESLVKESNQ